MSNDKNDKPVVRAGQSVFQTVLIVFLVLIVGLIFGIGQSSLTMAMNSKAVVEVQKGITNLDYQRYARIDTILKMVHYGMKPKDVDDNQWKMYVGSTEQQISGFRMNPLVLARLGDQAGMRPSGKQLEAIKNEFLSTKLGGEYATMREALLAVIKRGDPARTLTPIELENYLADKRTAQNYLSRYAPNLVVNKSAATVFKQLDNEKIKTEEATISVAALLDTYKAAAEAEPEALEAKYEEIKAERFLIPRSCQLIAIGADENQIKQALVVSDAAISAYYNENKETDPGLKKVVMPKAPAEGAAAPTPATSVKTLAESSAYIRGKLENEMAETLAIELCDQFTNGLISEGLVEEEHVATGKLEDIYKLAASISIPATDKRLNQAISLQVWKDLRADQPQDAKTYTITQADGTHFANMDVQNPSLFQKEPNSIFLRTQAADNANLQLFQIISGFTPQDYKPYASVKDEVVLLLSAEKAYPELLKQVEALAATAAQQPEQSLNDFFAEKAQQKWGAKIVDKTHAPLDNVIPLNDPDLLSASVMNYTQPNKGYYIFSAEPDGDMQRVTLARVVSFGPEAKAGTKAETSPEAPATASPAGAADTDDRYLSELKESVSNLSQRDLSALIDADLKKE